jgi:hypothetical protein
MGPGWVFVIVVDSNVDESFWRCLDCFGDDFPILWWVKRAALGEVDLALFRDQVGLGLFGE